MEIGVNLSGLTYAWRDGWDQQFIVTAHSEVDYFAAKGISIIRLPINWDSIQPNLGASLDSSYVANIQNVAAYANAHGIKVILDLHDFGSYNGHLIGSAEVPVTAFADFWGKLAQAFTDQPGIVFGLMNEPLVATAIEWLPAVNAAIEAIRGSGATTQQILVPGAHWDGAASWTDTDNATVLGAYGAIVDPCNNFAFEVHQYLDDTSGQHDWVVSESIGVERLQAITVWARAQGFRLFLGEFGVAANDMALTALDHMLAYAAANSDVWQGGSYWAAGQGWIDYMYSVEPELGLLDAAQMLVLQRYSGTHTSSTVLGDGTHRVDTYLDAGVTPTLSDVLDDGGRLLTRSLFDAAGHLGRKVVAESNGTLTLSTYSADDAAPAMTVEVFDASHTLLARSVYGTDLSRTVELHEGGVRGITRRESYDPLGILTGSVDHLGNGQHIDREYHAGTLDELTIYDASWSFISRANYDSQGRLCRWQFEDVVGDNIIEIYALGQINARTVFKYSPSWSLLSRAEYDNSGNLATYQETLSDGRHRVDYFGHPGLVTVQELYDTNWDLVSTEHAPAITSSDGGVADVLYVNENATAVVTVSAVDVDGTAPLYEVIGGLDALRFTINPATSDLNFLVAPDYEHPIDSNGDNVYSVIVQASDGILQAEQSLTVNVGNVDETNLPAVGSAPVLNIAEAAPQSTNPAPSAPINVGDSVILPSGPRVGSAEVDNVFRFFDVKTGHHFYTTSPDEKAHIQGTSPDLTYEGAAWATPKAGADTTDVFRFFDNRNGDHFFTTNAAERDTIIQTAPNLVYEGVAFQAFANGDSLGTFQVERFFNNITGDHHFSSSSEETAGINAGVAGPGWVDEGHGFTVHVPRGDILLA